MKKGDVINGYRLLQDFTAAGAGLSRWTFAEKSGKEYFLKEFLSPTYPVSGSPGSDVTKRNKRKRCEDFERHHHLLMAKLASRTADGGNLIVTTEFFRSGAKYYKTTEKVDVRGLTIAHIVEASEDRKALIMLTVGHSLRILHQAGVVHGDLKPDNMLIKESAKGAFVAKLIDFDNSYIAGSPAPVEEIVGDPVYYSPELLRYITGDSSTPGSHLQLASDIFALGLIYCQFLTGDLPTFDRVKHHYACEAVNAGSRVAVRGVPARFSSLLESMLHPQYDRRPTIEEVFNILKSGAVFKGTDGGDTAGAKPSGTLGGTLLKKTTAAGGRKDPVTPATPSTRLSGTLIKKRAD